MPLISQRFAIPTNDDAFEDMCLRLLRQHWSRPGLEIFGKRGERQFGIDILDVGGQLPIYAAQCKLKEEHKSLRPAEIEAEVKEARQFDPPLGKYAILTTGKVSTQAQRKVREINQAHRASNLFEVEVLNWERLCELLQQYPEVQEQFYREIGAIQVAKIGADVLSIKDGVETLTSRFAGDEFDSRINEARDCIAKGEFQFATLLLNLVQRKSGHNLSPPQQFRLLSNLGAAELGGGRPQSAAKLFMEALPWHPSNEQGRINEVFAYCLIGDIQTAHNKAATLRPTYPLSARLAALWLTTAPEGKPLAELEPEVQKVLRDDPEVSVALARRALLESDYDRAVKCAEAAARVAEHWSQPQLLLGQIHLSSATAAKSTFPGPRAVRESSLKRAETALLRAFELAQAEKDFQTQRTALIQRIDARLLQKKIPEAMADAEEAQKLFPADHRITLALALTRLAADQREEALVLLHKAHEQSPDPDIALIYAKTLHDRGQPGDFETALAILLRLPLRELFAPIRPAVAIEVTRSLSRKKDWGAAEKYLNSATRDLPDIVIKICRGFLAHFQGSLKDAELYAAEASSLLGQDVRPEVKEYLARLFMIIGRPSDALPVWQELFVSDTLEFDPGNLLDCAARLHRDDVVLQTCEELHKRGAQDWRLVEFELQYLQRYDIKLAIDRLQEFLRREPNQKLARLRLSQIGLLLNRPELVSATVQDLPPADEIPMGYAIAAVQVLKTGGVPADAVHYAYNLLRHNFNAIEAHRALIWSMMPGPSAPDHSPELEVVGPGAAVLYEETPGGPRVWVVLEDTDEPSRDFEEISLKSPLAIQLDGKRLGDQVVIAKGEWHDRLATIIQILPKYVRRYQDSAGELQVRFGAASGLEAIRTSSPSDNAVPNGLQVILDSVERRAAAVMEVRDLYNTGPVSLHIYGARFGTNAFMGMVDLANAPGLRVKVSLGNAEQTNQAIGFFQTPKAIVVDMTALASLRMLGLTKILSIERFRFVVAERTWITFREMLAESRTSPETRGTLTFEGGQHFFHEKSAEDRAEQLRQDDEFVRLLESVTDVRSGVELAALVPSQRELLQKLFGDHGAETMVISSHAEVILWTDDLVLAHVAAQEFGVRRVWTQVVIAALADMGLLTADEYHEASARLLAMGYEATAFDARTIFAALRLSKWNVEARAAIEAVKVFASPTIELGTLVPVLVGVIQLLYMEPLPASDRCSIVQRFLDSFAVRSEALDLLKNLRKLSPGLFRLNLLGKQQFERCFDLWLQSGSSPLVVPA